MTRISWALLLSSLFHDSAYSHVSKSSTATVTTESPTTTENPTALPPWSFSTFDFRWDRRNDTLTQCGHVTVSWKDSQYAHYLKPKAPFTMEWWSEGRAPYSFPVPFDDQTREYNWQVDLPVGGPYFVTMRDGNGASGGTGRHLFTVLPSDSFNTCTQATLQSNGLDLSLPDISTFVQCATVPVSVRGGKPPYKLTVLPKSIPPKSVSFSTGDFDYTLDVGVGKHVLFAVEDSTGLGAVSPIFVVGASRDASCLSAAETVRPDDPRLATIYDGKPTPTQGASIAPRSPTAAATLPQTKLQWWTSHLWIIASGIVGGALLFVFTYMLVRCCIFTRAKKKDKARYAKAASAEDDNTTMVGESTASLTTAGANGKPMTGAWIGTPRSQRLPPPGGFTPSPGGGFGQSPRRRTNASPAGANNGGTPLTDTPVRRTKSRAGQKGKYSIITSLDDDPEESEEARPAIGRTNSLYASSEYMRELRKKGAGPLPTSYNVVPNPDTERLPPTYFAVAEQPAAAGPSGSRSSPPRPAVVAVANEDRGDADGSTVLPGTRDFNRAYAQAKFPKRPIEGFPLSTSSLALVGEEEHPLQSQTSSANVSNATLVGPTQQETESGNGEQHNAQTRAESWVTFRAPDLERSRSSSPQYPPGLEADIAYEGINGSLEDEDFYEEEGRGLLDPLKEAEDDMDTSLPYRSNKARSRCTDNSSAMDQEAHETTPKRNSPQQPGTPGRRRPLPPTPGQPSLLSPNPFTAWSHPPKKEHEDEDEVQWGTTIRLLSAQGSMRSASSAESGEVVQTGQAI